ncbi:MAG: 16S rRNA (adenine(1518)-N(6)/adenine(1519)-N(6))-dimethyltransferase RsmA [Anaerolineae bacterium]|nr:16S rRNA (adenine(1518)-N(6)/adenine(1519)-N(6))-dimethyltransferase RsmA [Anaerolineae bacterium]
MNTRQLLHEYGIRPRKGLGQHFLVSEAHLRGIVAAAELAPDDMVLEIGPGLGTLTARLAAQAGHVVAVELDEQLIPILQRTLAGHANVTIVHGDILQLQPSDLVSRCTLQVSGPLETRNANPETYKVVANLPYYITSAVLRHLLEAEPPPHLLVLTVQQEVAERICAAPPEMSLLAVSVQFYAEPELVQRIPAGAFYPRPKVDSGVVRLRLRPQPAAAVGDVERFFEIVRAGFGQRRKQLRNALAHGLGQPAAEVAAALERAGIEPRRRAETLTLTEWGQVYRQLNGG